MSIDLKDGAVGEISSPGSNHGDPASPHAAASSPAILAFSELRGANLECSMLSLADLRGADLSGARLCGADLRNANLSGAIMRGADLTGANLAHADLTAADLRAANLTNANLADVLYDTATRWPDAFFEAHSHGTAYDAPAPARASGQAAAGGTTLRTAVSQRDGEVWVVVDGEIDLLTVDAFRAALAGAIEIEAPVSWIDLRGVDYLDSSALYALLDFEAAGTERRRDLRLLCGTPWIARILRMARLDPVILSRPLLES